MKLKTPNRTGWWKWHEGGCDSREPESILVVVYLGRATVAYDETLAAAIGRDPNETMCENYWEGTDCTPDVMPGSWTFDRDEPTLLTTDKP